MSKRFTIVALGEILWDLFPDGPRFGGAPANFACHAAALGAGAHMVGCVGGDQLGERALIELRERGVNTDGVRHCRDFPTGTVEVTLDQHGKPRFAIGHNAAWEQLVCSHALDRLAARADAVCFGSLGQRSETSRRTIEKFLAATPPPALRIFDINLRPPFFDEAVVRRSLARANVLKLNDEELHVLASMLGLSGRPAEALGQLQQRFHLRLVVLTRGERGALLVREGEVSDYPGFAVKVRDTVGAGDSFTAAVAVGLLRNEPLVAINQHANRVAAYVCSMPGATPELPDELRQGGGWRVID